MYLDHINGNVDAALRTANRPATAYDQVGDGSDDESSKASLFSGAGGGEVPDDAYKYDLPKDCYLEMFKLNRIEKLDEGFIVAVHPYP